MRQTLRTMHRAGLPIHRYLGLVSVSGGLQAAALILLFPTLSRLFSSDPGQAGPWVVGVTAIIAMVWVIDRWAATDGLTLGLSLMRVVHRRTPPTLLDATILDVATIRRLASQGAMDATSGIVLLITPLLNAWILLFFLGFGLVVIQPIIGLVTVSVGFCALAAVWLGIRLQTGAEAAYDTATRALDDRLFEFAWAQATWRTARAVESGTNVVGEAITRTHQHALRLLGWQIPNELVFSLVMQVALVAIGVSTWWSYHVGSLTGVQSAVMIVIALRIVEQITLLAVSTTSLIALHTTLTDVQQMVDPTPEVPALVDSAPKLTLDGVTVTSVHDGHSIPILQDITLECEPGTITVIVGPSGSGKTTLGRVIAGVQPVTSGTVQLNDMVASPAQLRATSAMVFQQTHLGVGTIGDNLTAVNPALTDAQRDEIAANAQLSAVVAALPKGWSSHIGELGTALSGGERQRVGMARALAKPAAVLVVDEATSALDTQHEQAIVRALSQIRGRYTTIVITHRPAALAIADQVVVLTDGRIVESGPPSSLAMMGGWFTTRLQQWDEAATWQPNRTRHA